MKTPIIKSNKEFTASHKRVFGKDGLQTELRVTVHALIVWGLKQYGEHGNLTCLNKVGQSANNGRTINITAVRDYIKAHANVKWEKNDKGTYQFRKVGNKAKVAEKFEGRWYDKLATADDIRAKADKLKGKDDIKAAKLEAQADTMDAKEALRQQVKVKSRIDSLVTTLKNAITDTKVDNTAMALEALRTLEELQGRLIKIEADGIVVEDKAA